MWLIKGYLWNVIWWKCCVYSKPLLNDCVLIHHSSISYGLIQNSNNYQLPHSNFACQAKQRIQNESFLCLNFNGNSVHHDSLFYFLCHHEAIEYCYLVIIWMRLAIIGKAKATKDIVNDTLTLVCLIDIVNQWFTFVQKQ